MIDVAKHIRIFESSPTNDFVKNRMSCINQIENAIKKKNSIDEILELANNLVTAILSPAEPSDFIKLLTEKHLKKSNASFVADQEHLQMLSCLLIATVQLMQKHKTVPRQVTTEEVLASAIWSGLSFHEVSSNATKLDDLIQELQEECGRIASGIGLNSRIRIAIEPRKKVEVTSVANNMAVEVEAVLGTMIDQLAWNAELDSEEIEILWWTIGGWSETLGLSIESLTPTQRCSVSAIEIVHRLKRFPTKAHVYLACRGIDATIKLEPVSFKEELEALTDFGASIADSANYSSRFPKVLPLTALIRNKTEIGNAKTRPLHEWVGRLLLELSLLDIKKFYHGN